MPKAKPVPGGILPSRAASLSQGFDEPLLGLQKAIGNQGVLRMLRDEKHGDDHSETLDASVRGVMESRFGADLSGVRVHRGESAAAAARQMSSSAFTFAKDIFFGAGRYAPHTPEGTQLLAHELTHVLQQQKGGTGAGTPPGAAHEAEASLAAASIAAGSPRVNVRQASGPGIAKQKEQPAPPAPQMVVQNFYVYTFEGKTITLTEEQYKAEIAKVTAQMSREFSHVQDSRDAGREAHKDFMENTHGIVGSISDILGDTVPPTLNIWSWPMSSIEQGRAALKEGRIKDAARFLKHAREDLKDAEHAWRSYINATISGAEAAVSDLETVRDVSFSIAIGTAAVVAAPVIAAGLAEAGVTGVAGTLATGGAVTAGGAGVGGVLRGGTSIAGQGLATGHVDFGTAWQETKQGAKHGAIDASTALVTAGTGRLLGKGTTVAGKVLRHGATGAVGGAFSSGVTAAAEGKSAGEVFESAGIGAVSGFAGGTVTSMLGGSGAQQSTTRRVLSGAAGSVASGVTATALSGGSTADIKRAVATSAITGIATSAAAPGHGGPTTEENPPKGKEPTHGASPGAGPASAAPDPAEIFSAPKKIQSKVIPREKIEQLRQKKLAARAQAEGKAAAPTKKRESNVNSLDEFRQRKAAAAAAKQSQPPTEAAAQAQPAALEQTAEAEMKLAAGAEGQRSGGSGAGTDAKRGLRIVAAANDNSSKGPAARPGRQVATSGKEPSRSGPRRPSGFTRSEIEGEIASAQRKVPERARVLSGLEASEEQAVREQETPNTPHEQLADRQHSRALRDGLEAAGIPVPEGHDAHHIVPVNGGGDAGDRARVVLEREGIHIDHPENGIPLPQTTLNPETIPEGLSRHQTIHTGRYYEALAAALEAAPPGTVRDLLQTIRTRIHEGRFLH